MNFYLVPQILLPNFILLFATTFCLVFAKEKQFYLQYAVIFYFQVKNAHRISTATNSNTSIKSIEFSMRERYVKINSFGRSN